MKMCTLRLRLWKRDCDSICETVKKRCGKQIVTQFVRLCDKFAGKLSVKFYSAHVHVYMYEHVSVIWIWRMDISLFLDVVFSSVCDRLMESAACLCNHQHQPLAFTESTRAQWAALPMLVCYMLVCYMLAYLQACFPAVCQARWLQAQERPHHRLGAVMDDQP